MPVATYLLGMNGKRIGDEGEELAARYLQELGHRLLARNWRSGRLEIDLITRAGDTVVFTEVKTRRDTRFGHPDEFVDGVKQDRLVRAATAWLAREGHEGEIRFDIIGIILKGDDPPRLTHIPDAFFPFH
jgi:putative endonuclease